jgi:hypothetical protein
MGTLNTIIVLLLVLGAGLISAGIIICIFWPKRILGRINWGKRGIPSLALGLPLILVGTLVFLFSLEPAYNHWRRVDYLKRAKYYLWSYKRYIIAGGENKTDKIVVDDDLRVVLNDDQIILNDHDGWRSDYPWARYKGNPIVFYSDDVRKLRIIARDVTCCAYHLSPLYLHKPDGTVVKLTAGVKGEIYGSAIKPRQTFFDETYELKSLPHNN